MIRFTLETGSFRVSGVDEPLLPFMRHTELLGHPARHVMPEVRARRAENHREYSLPEGRFDGCRVLGMASFTDGVLESLWLQVLAKDSDGSLFRYSREVPRILALQERWLRDVAGVESREYPWGQVWNRYNINAGWHDIAVIFLRREHP